MQNTSTKAKYAFLVSSLLFAATFLGPSIEAEFPNSSKSGLLKEKITRLQFYVQDWTSGENATVWIVASSDLTQVLPSAFGLLSMLDNLVTSGPEMGSGEVGRIQGLIGQASMHEMALVMLVNVVFTHGVYKGSTLSIVGRNPLNDEVREVPVVGGTGFFRMARGYALTTTYSVNEAHTHGVIVYDVVVWHLDGQFALVSPQ